MTVNAASGGGERSEGLEPEGIEQEITTLYPNGIPKNLSLGDAGKFKHARAQL